MKNFEDWQKDQKHFKKVGYGIALFCLFMGIFYEFKNGSIWWSIVGVFFGYISWNKKTTIERYEKTKEDYEKLLKKQKINQAIRKGRIEKENELLEREKLIQKHKLEQKEKPRREKYENRLKLLDELDSKLNKLNKIDIWDPTESRSILNTHENEISKKIGDDDLHKILKIVNFITDFSKEVDNIRFAIIDEININDFKNNLRYDFQRDHDSMEVLHEILQFQNEGGVYGRTRVEGLTESIIALGDKIIPTFENEIKKIQYLEGLCISMIIFGIEGKKLRYFEILESFEKLGALDSTWQKNIQQRLGSIEAKLDFIIGGILSLNGKMDDLISNGDQVIKELESINSSIATGNLIQALNLYQNYKINKNTKSLRQ